MDTKDKSPLLTYSPMKDERTWAALRLLFNAKTFDGLRWSETAVLLTESDVAARLAISIHTVRKWRRRKTGPPYVKIGRSVRYPQGGLQEFIEDSTPPRKPPKREEAAE